ncbi:MAG: glycosyltransferase family 39 protein, partial [Chloroflexaceae bacterium]|nr:glycosyltransferase family 39 protein [Chloroflexaceae bacterium]
MLTAERGRNEAATVAPRSRLRQFITHPVSAYLCLWLLLGLLVSVFMRPPPPVPADDPNVFQNVWDVEQNGSDSFRWTQPGSALRLFGVEQPLPLALSLRMTMPRPEGSAPVPISIGDVSFSASSNQWRRYEVLLPPQRRSAESPLVRLQSAGFIPAGDDTRELGVAISAMQVQPLRGTWLQHQFYPERWLFLLLLAGLVLFMPRWGFPLAGGLSLALALLTILHAATLARWLPNLWLGLAVAYGACGLWRLTEINTAKAPRLPSFASFAPLREPFPLVTGLLLVLAATLLAPWIGAVSWGLLLAGLACLWLALPPRESVPEAPFPREYWLLAAIVLASLGLRLGLLFVLPADLWRDEARGGLHVLQIINDPSFRPVYLPFTVDIPALLIYLAVPFVQLFGPTPLALRLAPTLVAGLTPLALWFAARPLIGARGALLAAALLLGSSWHMATGRIFFATALSPFFTLVAVGALLRTIEAEGRWRWGWAMLCGLSGGIALYAYHPSRLTAPLLALTALVLLWRNPAWRRAWQPLALAALVLVLIDLPMLFYVLDASNEYMRRLGQTTLFNAANLGGRAPLALLEQNAAAYLNMWFWRGDPNPRHYLPATPMLDPFSAAAFAVGCVLALRHVSRPMLILLLWLGVMFAPGLLSGSAPHTMRAIEMLPPALLLAAAALVTLAQRHTGAKESPLAPLGKGGTRLRAAESPPSKGGMGGFWRSGGLLALVVAGSLSIGVWRMFVAYPANPEVAEAFSGDDTRLGLWARQVAVPLSRAGYRLLLPVRSSDPEVLDMLVADLPVQRFQFHDV